MTTPTPQPRASVVVPTRGYASSLRGCLESLDRQDADFDYEVVLVDSVSDPRVAAEAAKHPRVRLVRTQGGLLPGPGRNLGVQEARGEILVFLDADCVAEPGYVRAAVGALGEPDGPTRLVGGPVLDARPWNLVCAADNFSQFADFPPGRPEEPAEYFPGCNMAVRRQDFLAVGGFSALTMPAGEDTLLCFAVAQRWPGGLRFCPGMRMRHLGRSTLPAYLKHQAFFGHCRGTLGIKVSPTQRRLGRLWVMTLPIAAKRFAYMIGRTVRYHPRGLPRLLLLSPLLLPGYLAWSVGFRKACRSAPDTAHPPQSPSPVPRSTGGPS